MCVYIYLSQTVDYAAYCLYHCCFCLRNKSMYSILSHKYQVFLDNLTDGYYINIDSDYLLTELFNLCNILKIKNHKREQILAQESVSFVLIKAQIGRGRGWRNLPKSDYCFGEDNSSSL